ncbi:hypothetical protein KX729_25775 [Rhizobium sp. XQZ8]|uniref:hypothetical protein n=1 Tax=Rhizobium populisoli TaxID=2859785 RepID=UPI001CA4E83E|nr:hypothetical protein [Rhizobium populisoli]MBW6424862.1 hypothetical protein [Rhizobium populisoli]
MEEKGAQARYRPQADVPSGMVIQAFGVFAEAPLRWQCHFHPTPSDGTRFSSSSAFQPVELARAAIGTKRFHAVAARQTRRRLFLCHYRGRDLLRGTKFHRTHHVLGLLIGQA